MPGRLLIRLNVSMRAICRWRERWQSTCKSLAARRKLVRGLLAYVAQFDMAIRKLLPELQSGSQRLHENPIFRFRLSVYFDDVAFVRRSVAKSFFMRTPSFAPTAV